MSDRTFQLPWSNPDIDIHPDPPEGWHRVVVVGGWQSAERIRGKWPHAACVGPLRTVRGIDLLIRALLANPQIRVVVWDGPDLTPGEATKGALQALWAGLTDLGTLELSLAQELYQGASLVTQGGLTDVTIDEEGWTVYSLADGSTSSMYGGRPHPTEEDADHPPVILPPPTPKPTTRAPHGDAGQRIAGDTLADVWPRVLAEALRAGRELPTHYGPTRELLGLVSVIRDPKLSVQPRGRVVENFTHGRKGDLHCTVCGTGPWAEEPAYCPTCLTTSRPEDLPFSWAELEEYTARLTTAAKAEGADYSYGSLLTGAGRKRGVRRDYSVPLKTVDQIAAVEQQLREDPGYRGHYMTPWHPSRFAKAGAKAGAKGRPCLVGVQFRAVPPFLGDGPTPNCERCERAGERCMRCTDDPQHAQQVAGHTLHALVTFRSHDLFGAYPQNLAAVCLWLTRLAEEHGMGVGQVMCVSHSAHVYQRDWAAAQEVAAAGRAPVVRWDQRSSWRVTRTGGPVLQGQKDVRYDELTDGEFYWTCRNCGRTDAHSQECTPGEALALRAEALTPDGSEVIAVFESPSPGNLRLQIERSGLVTEIGAALWLGAEIDRVWGAP